MKIKIGYILGFMLACVICFAVFQNYSYNNYKVDFNGKIDSLEVRNTFLAHRYQNLKKVDTALRKELRKRDSIYKINKSRDSIHFVREYDSLKNNLLEKEPNERVDYFLDKTSDTLIKINSGIFYSIPLENIDSANMIILERNKLYNDIALLLSNNDYLNKKMKELGYIIENKDDMIAKLEEIQINNKNILKTKDLRMLETEGIIKKRETTIRYLYGLAGLVLILAILK